jgi:molybdenum cofactor biosynthesis protein B
MQPVNTTAFRCGILTISTTHDSESDKSSTIAHDSLTTAGHMVVQQRWLVDDISNIRHVFREWIDSEQLDVILAIGGTGLRSTDVTPEALAPLITKPMPGFGEIFRLLAFYEFGVAAVESRACAAVCQRTLFYVLPGAPEAVSLALSRLIVPQLSTVAWAGHQRLTMAPPEKHPLLANDILPLAYAASDAE